MFLSPEIYEWPYDAVERGAAAELDYLFRPHDIWTHAAMHLEGRPTDLHRVDCISSLRRAINHRLKALSGVYNFEALHTGHAKRQLLERMREFGLVRPTLLKELLDVRNLIEHQDADPPSLEACHRFVDIVWYFLKSTDALVDRPVSRLAYEEGEGHSSVYIDIEPSKDWVTGVDGQIHESLLLSTEQRTALKLVNLSTTKVKGKKGYVKFRATVHAQGDALLKVAHEYFSAAGYWHET
jgi:hypothetical protein